MNALITTLAEAVRTEPRGLRATQLVQQLFSACLQLLQQPDEDKLSALAESSAEAARTMRPPNLDSDELWRAWYAGQLQTVAALCRTLLRMEIPLSVRRKILAAPNHASILLALADDDELTQTELLGRVKTNDPSQLSREVMRLQELRVVDVAREGKRSWVRLSALGRRIVAVPTLRHKLLDAVRRIHVGHEVAATSAEAETVIVDAEKRAVSRAAPPGAPAMVPPNADDTGERIRLQAASHKSATAPAAIPVIEKPKRKSQEKLMRAVLDDSTG